MSNSVIETIFWVGGKACIMIKGVNIYTLSFTPETELVSQEQDQSTTEESSTEESSTEESSEDEEKEKPKVVEREYLKGSINGFALKREQVLQIEELLKSSPYFEKIIAPLQNIYSPTDVDFVFDFRAKMNDDQ